MLRCPWLALEGKYACIFEVLTVIEVLKKEVRTMFLIY